MFLSLLSAGSGAILAGRCQGRGERVCDEETRVRVGARTHSGKSTPKSNTRNRIFTANCTRDAVSCV
eukprot:1592480-Rhodomonas_salina.1